MNIARYSVSLRQLLRGINRDFSHVPMAALSTYGHRYFYDSSKLNCYRQSEAVTPLRHILNCDVCNCHLRRQDHRGFRTNAFGLAQKADEDEILGRGEKMIKTKLATTRLDAVIKAGLGMSKNKIEKALYDDRVRVNGTRPKKKSECVYEGDEIDIVRGYNKLNPDFIDVARVEIVQLIDPKDGDRDDDEDSDSDERNPKIPAKLRRSKTLTIKNYTHPWKGTDMEN